MKQLVGDDAIAMIAESPFGPESRAASGKRRRGPRAANGQQKRRKSAVVDYDETSSQEDDDQLHQQDDQHHYGQYQQPAEVKTEEPDANNDPFLQAQFQSMLMMAQHASAAAAAAAEEGSSQDESAHGEVAHNANAWSYYMPAAPSSFEEQHGQLEEEQPKQQIDEKESSAAVRVEVHIQNV